MKKYFSAFCVLALTAGCAKENIAPVQTSNEVILTSYAGQPRTKTTISGNKTDGFTANWAETDAIGVYTTAGTANAKHTITLLSDGTAKFTGKVTASENGQTLYAYYPYTSGATSNPAAALLNLPTVQTMAGVSYDASAAIMVGKPQTATIEGDSKEIGNWQFAHLNSYIQISTTGITAEGISAEERVSKVTLKAAGKKLAGDFTLNLEDGQTTFTKASAEVSVDVPDGTTLGNLAAWVVTAPFSLANEELLIKIETKDHIIAKSVALTKEFKAGNVYTLGINIDENCAVKKALAFAKEYSVSERTCYWRGGAANKKVYEVSSTIDWKVSITDSNEATVTKNDDGKSFTVVFPKSKWPVTKKYTVTLEPATAIEGVASKTMDLFLASHSWMAGDSNCFDSYDDGSVKLTLSANGNACLQTSETFKYGNYVWTFENVNISEGYFGSEIWENGLNLRMRYGVNTHVIYSGGTVDHNGVKTNFGFDNGWGDVWDHTGEFSAGTYPENVSDLKSIRLLIKPVTRGGGMKPVEALSKKIWINDVLVFDNKNNSGDVWRINTALGGLHYKYGILNAVGSIVIKSFDIDENYSNYND